MVDEQPSKSNLVCIQVRENRDLTFFYDLSKATIIPKSDEIPSCYIEVSEIAYKRLLNGTSNFESEARSDNLKIKGKSQALQQFGTMLRKTAKLESTKLDKD